MKSYLFIIIGIISISFCVNAKPVSELNAATTAVNFLRADMGETNIYNGDNPIKNTIAIYPNTQQSTNQDHTPCLFIFNRGNNTGFVIISGDDYFTPVLGYTDAGTFNYDNLPSNLKFLLNYYQSQITSHLENTKYYESANPNWDRLSQNISLKKTGTGLQSAVAPMVKSQWHQRGSYNAMCPYDYRLGDIAVAGCTAIALGQMLKFWSYPVVGKGYYSYLIPTFGTIYANFGATKYDWSSMPNKTYTQNDAAARLVFHVGVSEQMHYNVAESDAYFYIKNQPCSFNALRDVFGYKDIKLYERADYSIEDWKQIIDKDLKAGMPVLLSGQSPYAGHTFICDGSDDGGLYHINWGWEGYCDGFFNLDILDPYSGTDKNNSFNGNLEMIANIHPPVDENGYKLELDGNVNISEKIVPYKHGFTISSIVKNSGNEIFSGELQAEIIDSTGKIFADLPMKTDQSIGAGNTLQFSTEFTPSDNDILFPGLYTVVIMKRDNPNDRWSRIVASHYKDYENIQVKNNNENTVRAKISLPEGLSLYTDYAATVNVELENSGSAEFSGKAKLVILNANGLQLFEFDNTEEVDLQPNDQKSKIITFKTNKLSLSTGNYFLALYVAQNDKEWSLAGSPLNSSNPQYVFVRAWMYFGDIYEDNNTDIKPTKLKYNCFTQFEDIGTPNANINTTNDVDYYGISLSSTWNYRVYITIDDAIHGTLPYTYTGNVNFAYKTNNTDWSQDFNNSIEYPFFVKGPDFLSIRVKPDDYKGIGTYNMNIRIERLKTSDVAEIDPNTSLLSVFPNPADDFCSIASDIPINLVELIDATGMKIAEYRTGTNRINLSGLPSGMYFIVAHTQNGIIKNKIIKR